MKGRVPIQELIEPARLRALGPAPSPAALRGLLPRGWVLAEDGLHARRDLRLFFREGWILLVCLVVFGSLGAMFVLGAVPRGRGGALRVLALIAAVWLAAGIAGPLVTRALRSRDRRAPARPLHPSKEEEEQSRAGARRSQVAE